MNKFNFKLVVFNCYYIALHLNTLYNIQLTPSLAMFYVMVTVVVCTTITGRSGRQTGKEGSISGRYTAVVLVGAVITVHVSVASPRSRDAASVTTLHLVTMTTPRRSCR